MIIATIILKNDNKKEKWFHSVFKIVKLFIYLLIYLFIFIVIIVVVIIVIFFNDGPLPHKSI